MSRWRRSLVSLSILEFGYALAVAMVCGGWPWSLIPFAGAAVIRTAKKCVAILFA
jgi:hypothetical protein